MVQSVELLLRHEDELAVRSLWDALLADGLPSQARHTGASNRPHVTLVAVPRVAPDAEARLADAVADLLPADATWGALTRFGQGPWTVVRLLEPSARMRLLQQRVAEVCDASPDSFSAPNRWTAHATLARRVRTEDLSRVLEVVEEHLGDHQRGMPVVADVVRRWDGDARREWLVAGAGRQA